MSRRFLYLLVDNTRHGTFALRRINVSGLFYPTKPPNGSTGAAGDAKHTANLANNAARIEDAHLPRPVITFHPLSTDFETGSMQFMLFSGHGKNQIIGADQRGRILSYNTDSHTIRLMPSLNKPKNMAMSLTVGDNFYVMDKFPQPSDMRCFEALVYGRPMNGQFGKQDWYWHALAPPPYVFEAGYEPSSHIRSYTVVRDSNICISAKDIGTYSFDTASSVWSKTGDWALPFHGCAEHVPEYNIWFGLSSVDNLLCTSDLSATSKLKPPTLCQVWKELNPPEEWNSLMSYVVHVGSGKFCIARFFETSEEEPCENGYVYQNYERFAVFTGVELEPCNMAGGEFRMTTHKSKRYRFVNKVAEWVL
uniref:Uncharacterized protein n=1 Tax=Arundo donax TaxID=35708 RepID=A0A0A8Y5B2_ARUDO